LTVQYTFQKKIVPSYTTVAVVILDEVMQPEMFICTQFYLQGIFIMTHKELLNYWLRKKCTQAWSFLQQFSVV